MNIKNYFFNKQIPYFTKKGLKLVPKIIDSCSCILKERFV